MPERKFFAPQSVFVAASQSAARTVTIHYRRQTSIGSAGVNGVAEDVAKQVALLGILGMNLHLELCMFVSLRSMGLFNADRSIAGTVPVKVWRRVIPDFSE